MLTLDKITAELEAAEAEAREVAHKRKQLKEARHWLTRNTDRIDAMTLRELVKDPQLEALIEQRRQAVTDRLREADRQAEERKARLADEAAQQASTAAAEAVDDAGELDQ